MLALLLPGFMILGISPLRAASAKKLVLTPSEEKTFTAWENFLSDGTQTWSTTHAPPFTEAIRSTIWQVIKTDTEAQAIANPMVEYLEWRRSLDPKRFTYYHPNLSPDLAQLLNSSSLPTGVPPPTYTPVPETAPQTLTTPSSPSGAQTVSPQTVPEPSSLLLAAAMTGWGIWWRHRLAKQTSR